jgi:two-component system response regulator
MNERRILLVEDDPDGVELTLRALKTSNPPSHITVARDGVEALEYLFGTGPQAARDLDSLPQLILLDLKLPRMDGLDVLRRLRADTRTRHIPVVVLTSSTEESDLASSYALGANSYIRKPVDFREFVEAARHLGIYWLRLNQFPPAARR